MHKRESVIRPIALLGAQIVAGVLILMSASGCDRGGRDKVPIVDSGVDGGDENDAGAIDEDAGPGWRYEDAGNTWDDGTVTIDGPCNNDCEYVYDMVMYEFDDVRGKSSFTISPGGFGEVEARGVDWATIIMHWSWPDIERYRQRMLANYVLDETTHALISGEVTVYNMYSSKVVTRGYSFAYDDFTHEFTYTIDVGGRNWTRTVSTPNAPLIMFNHREYPIETHGSHSSLFAFMMAERYNWSAGGTQYIPIFSPEMERFDVVAVGKQGADTLVVSFPVDSAKPLWHSDHNEGEIYDTNDLEFRYEYGIPVYMETRHHYKWEVVSAVPPEINMSLLPASTQIYPPAVSGGYTTASMGVTSGSISLAGEVDDPVLAGPHRAVIMLPGWDHMTRIGEVGAVDMYSQLADRLAASGTLVVRMDARGKGASTGALEMSTVDELVDDGVAIVAAISAMSEVESTEVFLLAQGLGVHIAAKIADDSGTNVAGIILISPVGYNYKNFADDIWVHYLSNAGSGGNFINAKKNDVIGIFEDLDDGTYSGDAYMGHKIASWQSLFAEDLITSPFTLPDTLIVMGDEDHLIPTSFADDLETALVGASTTVTKQVLPGLTHALTVGTAAGLWPEHSSMEAVDDTAVNAVNQWLDAQTGG